MAEGYRCEGCREKATRCEACRSRRAAARTARRARRRKAGACTECGRDAAEGLSRCQECSDDNNARSGAAHIARRAEEG
jgi:hypothetical protein